MGWIASRRQMPSVDWSTDKANGPVARALFGIRVCLVSGEPQVVAGPEHDTLGRKREAHAWDGGRLVKSL
jgi:hypothetical protein